MAGSAMGSTREVPREFLITKLKWQRWSIAYYWLNLSLGGLSVVLCAAYASNAKLSPQHRFSPYVGAIAAVLTFLLTAGKPSARSTAYKAAAYELDKGILAFRNDPDTTIKHLVDAETRAIDLLSRLNPT